MWKKVFRFKYMTTPFVMTNMAYRNADHEWATYTEGYIFGLRIFAIRQ